MNSIQTMDEIFLFETGRFQIEIWFHYKEYMRKTDSLVLSGRMRERALYSKLKDLHTYVLERILANENTSMGLCFTLYFVVTAST